MYIVCLYTCPYVHVNTDCHPDHYYVHCVFVHIYVHVCVVSSRNVHQVYLVSRCVQYYGCILSIAESDLYGCIQSVDLSYL